MKLPFLQGNPQSAAAGQAQNLVLDSPEVEEPFRYNTSPWLTVSIFLIFVMLFVASQNQAMVLVLPVLYVSSFFLKPRFRNDSANIWGARLAVYALLTVLGRMPTVNRLTYPDAQTFATVGLVFGGEIILLTYRQPPKSLRYDPVIILVSGLLFLVACNSYNAYQFAITSSLLVLSPLYIFTTILALGEVQLPSPNQTSKQRMTSQLGRAIMACTAVCVGFILHWGLVQNRNALMSLSARLISDNAASLQGDTVSDSPHLESSFGANTSTSRLMKIKGSLSDAHLRAGAFDHYDHGIWGPALSTRPIKSADAQYTHENVTDSPTADQRTDYDTTITVLRPTNEVMFVPLNVEALVPLAGSSFDWDQFEGPLRISDTPPVSYGIIQSKTDTAGIQTAQGPLCLPPDPDQRAKLLDIPEEIEPEVKDLAIEITKNKRTQLEKVQAIIDYLFKNNKYSFTFTRSPQDPISDFLLNHKSGHCQYFGSAATMLMREVGIPARYATGYWAHETASDGTTIVRGRDAHAWSEAYIDKIGWITVEATPPSGRADPAVNPLPWYQTTVEWIQDTFTRIRDWFGRLTPLQIVELVSAALLIWGAERWRQSRKKQRRLIEITPVPAELAPLAQRFEKVLAKRGISLTRGRPWSESLPEDWDLARNWVELYNQMRFGEQEHRDLEALQRELNVLEKEPVPNPTVENSETATENELTAK